MNNIKVIIKGAIGNFNFGDDLLTYAMCVYLQRLSVQFEVTIISNEQYLSKHIGDIRIEREYSINSSFDIMVYAGGTQFASFSDNKMGIIFLLKRVLVNLTTPHLIYKKIKTKFFGANLFSYKKLALLGVGIGPFHKKDQYFEATKRTLLESDFLAVRDILSESICRDNKINFVNGSDLVYSIPDSYWNNFKNKSTRVKSIAVIVRDWGFTDNEATFIYHVQKLKYKGCKVQFFSFCRNKDQRCIELLSEAGFENSISIWDPEKQAFDDYLAILSEYDLFITSRYHGAIIASILNTPFISIGIEPKLTMVAEVFNMPSWNYPYHLEECEIYIKDIDENYRVNLENLSSQVTTERMKNAKMLDAFYEMCIKNS